MIAEQLRPRIITRPHYWPVKLISVNPNSRCRVLKNSPEVEWIRKAKSQLGKRRR